MLRKNLSLWLLFTATLLVLVACGNREEGAALLAEQASAAERAGDLPRAEAVYRQIVRDFPQTQATARAGRELSRFERQKNAARDKTRPLFESLVMVFEGYRALYGAYPGSPGEIDASGYMFDSSYMSEQVPADMEVFVALGSGDNPYRIWVLPLGRDRGLTQSRSDSRPEEASRVELTTLLGASLSETARIGRLVFLAPSAAVGK